MDGDTYRLHRNSNCRFYSTNKLDGSKIAVIENKDLGIKILYCVNSNCVGYDSGCTKPLQFDDSGHSMKGCLMGGHLEDRLPVDKFGKAIDLVAVMGVRG